MADTKNDRARRKRDAVSAAIAAKKKIDVAVTKRQTAKSKIRPELDEADDALRKAEDELRAASEAALVSGALTLGDHIRADGYVVSVTKTNGKTRVSVERVTKQGKPPERPGRGRKVKTDDGDQERKDG